jgi:hypothetical protein
MQATVPATRLLLLLCVCVSVPVCACTMRMRTWDSALAGWLGGGGVLGDKGTLNHLGIARFNLQHKHKQHHRTCSYTVDADVDVRCEMRLLWLMCTAAT